MYAQIQEREVLFTIDEKPYYVDEFIQIYGKELQFIKDITRKDLDSHLDLFVTYKLKVGKSKESRITKYRYHSIKVERY